MFNSVFGPRNVVEAVMEAKNKSAETKEELEGQEDKINKS